MERVLPCTVRPQRASELYALAEERHGGALLAMATGVWDRF